jgi:hypothetical protein
MLIISDDCLLNRVHLVFQRGLLDPSDLALVLVLALVKVLDLPQVTAVDDSVDLPLFNRLVSLIGVPNPLAENGTCKSAPLIDLIAKGAPRHL